MNLTSPVTYIKTFHEVSHKQSKIDAVPMISIVKRPRPRPKLSSQKGLKDRHSGQCLIS